MKKSMLKLMFLSVLLGVAGCSAPSQPQSEEHPTSTPHSAAAEPEVTETVQPTDLPQTSEEASKTLVVYFSATGNTKPLAEAAASYLEAELFEIIPAEPYTEDDLNYNDDDSRSSREMNDESSRPAMAESIENFEDYAVVVLAYPIWWGQAPRIVSTFVESVNFNGKTVIPFCTSGSSSLGSSAESLQAQANNEGTWLEGRRFPAGTSADEIADWLESLNLSE